MKKFIKILSLLLVISSVAVFQACKDDDPTVGAPTLTGPTDAAGVQVSTTKDVTFNFTTPAGYSSAAATATGGTVAIKTPGTDGTTEGTVVVTFTADATVGAGTVTLTVTDKANATAVALAALNKTTLPPVEPTILTGNLTANQTLAKNTNYIIKNQFVVMPGVTLTVEAGAVVKGDKATKGVLVVKPTGTLIANGTAESPIVFTSSQPVGERDKGDWGGIILMGDAYVNQSTKPSVEGLTPPANDNAFFQYGTINQADATVGINDQNSGSLKYVRIEYAGIELIPNAETNGLTMAGVGSGTTIDYVQSSYGGDDAFEWFGGSVSAKHLVAMATWDDDFDTDFGWRGNVQFGLSVRAPFIADQSGSTSFESDSQGNANAIGTVCDGTNSTGCTQGVFSNMTIYGPRDLNSTNAAGATRAISGNYTRAMHIRRRTAISIFNSYISGYGSAAGPVVQGLEMDDQGTLDNYTAGVGAFGNNVLVVPDPTANVEYGSNVAGANTTTVKGFWETENANGSVSTVVKPAAGAPWSLVAGSSTGSVVPPYAQYGITVANYYGSQTTATYPSNPDFAVASGDLTGQSTGTLFASTKLGTFFDKTVTYKGAFGATDWTDGWSEFQPLNKAY
jgi:hypothetical protein